MPGLVNVIGEGHDMHQDGDDDIVMGHRGPGVKVDENAAHGALVGDLFSLGGRRKV